MLNFYDFEVFKYDWMVVIINPIEKAQRVIVNDPEELKEYYNAHSEEIWIGYNNRRYDQYIMKAILLGIDPYKVNYWIIGLGKGGWDYSSLMKKIPMINFDTMLRVDTGLKTLEAFMGNDIRETSVPFDIGRKLTEEEINETIKYCTHDVEQTIEVFLARKAEFDAALGLVKIFHLPMQYMGKTGAQRVAKILGGKGQHFHDEFDFQIVDTLKLGKYKGVDEWYRRKENQDYSKRQKVMIAGVEHTLAWGGIHAAIPKYHAKGLFLMADVTAYYPSLQLRYKFGYRNMGNPENFELIYNENLRFKKAGDKKARLPYKIAANAISGQLKDQFSSLYDPRENNAITVNGQLLLVDLIDKLEPYCQLIQSNTDGILIKLNAISDFDKIDDLVYEWEERTGMRMEFEWYNEIFQKDVNNYLLLGKKNKSKGGYTKALSPIDNDLPIINTAVIEYMTKKIDPWITISNCNDLWQFQKVVKLSSKYWRAWHNGQYMVNKCYRVFASTRPDDTYIGKCKAQGLTIEKFGNTPSQCFIDNTDVKGKTPPVYLNKAWYVSLAKDRLAQFGVRI